jgi:hypothetical protein
MSEYIGEGNIKGEHMNTNGTTPIYVNAQGKIMSEGLIKRSLLLAECTGNHAELWTKDEHEALILAYEESKKLGGRLNYEKVRQIFITLGGKPDRSTAAIGTRIRGYLKPVKQMVLFPPARMNRAAVTKPAPATSPFALIDPKKLPYPTESSARRWSEQEIAALPVLFTKDWHDNRALWEEFVRLTGSFDRSLSSLYNKAHKEGLSPSSSLGGDAFRESIGGSSKTFNKVGARLREKMFAQQIVKQPPEPPLPPPLPPSLFGPPPVPPKPPGLFGPPPVPPVPRDATLLAKIRYLTMGVEIGASTKEQAFDAIVAVLK